MKYRIGGILVWAALTGGCAPVTGTAVRGVPAASPIGQIDVVSLLALHPAATPRLRADMTAFGETLGGRLREARFAARTIDVPALVKRNDLPIEVLPRDEEGRRHLDGLLPEKALLALETEGRGSHRLILFPALLASDRRSGVTVAAVHWRLEPSSGGKALASGVLRCTADARGFPGRRLADELVAELDGLGLRGESAALH